MAGSPCSIEVMKQVQSRLHMPEVTISYGMTETVLSTQSNTANPTDRRVSTVGRVLPHFEIKIVDPSNGQVVPGRDVGRVVRAGRWPHGWVLEQWCCDTASDRLRALDAHWRSGHHGPRWLLEHRRPHQGHDNPRR
jgi:hypothetical protein